MVARAASAPGAYRWPTAAMRRATRPPGFTQARPPVPTYRLTDTGPADAASGPEAADCRPADLDHAADPLRPVASPVARQAGIVPIVQTRPARPARSIGPACYRVVEGQGRVIASMLERKEARAEYSFYHRIETNKALQLAIGRLEAKRKSQKEMG